MIRWQVALGYGLAKAAWSTAIVAWLAAAEPFWHQALLVLGGAAMTSGAVVAAAVITSRRVGEPVQEIKHDLAEHRETIEDGHDPGDN